MGRDGAAAAASLLLFLLYLIHAWVPSFNPTTECRYRRQVGEWVGWGGASRKGRKELSVGDKNVKNAAANRGPSLN